MKPEIRAKKDKCTLVASVDHGKLRVLGASDDPLVILEGQVLELRASGGYARALYQMPGIAATCDIDECKLHYYGSLRMVNPSGVVPKGPKLDFTARHGRG